MIIGGPSLGVADLYRKGGARTYHFGAPFALSGGNPIPAVENRIRQA